MKENGSGAPPRILLVEDNVAHANLLLAGFERRGLVAQIRRARDGEEALDILFGETYDPPPPPDALLLDLRLPKIGGLEVLAKVRASGPLSSLPVVILTTSDAESDLAGASQSRADSYLVKPVDIGRLAAVLDGLGIRLHRKGETL